jgi:hypothetical protein
MGKVHSLHNHEYMYVVGYTIFSPPSTFKWMACTLGVASEVLQLQLEVQLLEW